MEKAPRVEKPEPIDAQWYDRFEEVGSFQAFEYLKGDPEVRSTQKKQFINGDVKNPKLDYPQLDIDQLKQREQSLLNLKSDVLQGEKNDLVKQVYRWKINEKIAEARLLKAAANGDARRFKRYSEFIYGKPSAEVFSYTVESLRSRAKQHAEQSDNKELQQAARDLDDILPKNLSPAEFTVPGQQTVNAAQKVTREELGDLINIPEAKGPFSTEEIQQSFDGALQKLQAKGWRVAIDPSSASMSVNQEQRRVNIPPSKQLPSEKLQQLIAHEIGTHVAQREHGERSKLKLLGLGLDRSEKGEEGVAMMREQAIQGQVEDFAGLDGHLAIGLANGLDGNQRDFRGVYEILYKHNLVRELARGTGIEQAREKAENKAWERCTRTFRGTDCQTPGTAFTKDIIYREGSIGVWQVVTDTPAEMHRFSVGKYDPSNARHIWVLDQAGITDQDLKSLAR